MRPIKKIRVCDEAHHLTSARCILDPPGRCGNHHYPGHTGPHWGPTTTGHFIQWPKETTP